MLNLSKNGLSSTALDGDTSCNNFSSLSLLSVSWNVDVCQTCISLESVAIWILNLKHPDLMRRAYELTCTHNMGEACITWIQVLSAFFNEKSKWRIVVVWTNGENSISKQTIKFLAPIQPAKQPVKEVEAKRNWYASRQHTYLALCWYFKQILKLYLVRTEHLQISRQWKLKRASRQASERAFQVIFVFMVRKSGIQN